MTHSSTQTTNTHDRSWSHFWLKHPFNSALCWDMVFDYDNCFVIQMRQTALISELGAKDSVLKP